MDHLVGANQQRGREGYADRLRRFEVEDQLDFCDLLHRKVGRLVAFENSPGIDAGLLVEIAEAAAIAHKAADQDGLTEWVDRGQRMAGRQRRELFHPPVEEVAAADQDRTNALLRKTCEGRFDEAATRIREEVDADANIIVGATFEESLDGIIRVSVVATGVDINAADNVRPSMLSHRPAAA